MESGVKRRKIDRGGFSLRHDGLIDVEARNAALVSSASTFVLQTDELLRKAKLDYSKALKDVDGTLFRLKTIVDSIEPHASLPVSLTSCNFAGLDANQLNAQDCRGDSKVRKATPNYRALPRSQAKKGHPL